MVAKIYKCFIASPGDTAEERKICDLVFEEINRGIGQTLNFRIESLKWEKDARPAFGADGQSVINEQIGSEYDIFIGIMYKKFGTPTERAGSGTEEEFNNAHQKYLKDKIEIMFYFNDSPPSKLSDVNPIELEKVNGFRTKVAELGGLYCIFLGPEDFKSKLRDHVTKYFLTLLGAPLKDKGTVSVNSVKVKELMEKRFREALQGFSSQPIIWVEPTISLTNDISQNPDDNYNNRIALEKIIESPESTIVKAPPQFGLTCLAHYLVKEAWERGDFWIYLNSESTKPHTIHNAVTREAGDFDKKLTDVKCIILDQWSNYESTSMKKLKNLSDTHKEIPIILMQTIDDSKFLHANTSKEQVAVNRNFGTLHLLALPRTHIRKVVSEYNKVKVIGDEDSVLAKIVADLETLNIHRTPYNCLTLLKVSEKYFDESPINRTKMIEMVLFILFNLDEGPVYSSRPDLTDCEYVLGRFCEKMIRNDSYEFTRDYFISELENIKKEKLFDLEVDVVFEILLINNIIARNSANYSFRSSFWVFYFAARRMHGEPTFAEFVFKSKKYVAFPELIEFYTGIDRNRSDAIRILTGDLTETCDIVYEKVGIPDNTNPLDQAKWNPTEESIEELKREISDDILNSRLPDEIKDKYADKGYDQVRPYNQSIQQIFEKYSLHNLMQKIKATSRALRNSDYVSAELKKEVLKEILRSWEQLSKVLFALAPTMASKSKAVFEGTEFALSGNFGDSYEIKLNRIFQVIPTNVVGYFKDDLFSPKLGPLLFEYFENEENPIKKHELALLIIFGRPRNWKKRIEDYIVSLPKNSFWLFNAVNALKTKYRYDFASDETLREISYLVKMGLAKHEFGDKKPGLDKIRLIANQNLPKREFSDDENAIKYPEPPK